MKYRFKGKRTGTNDWVEGYYFEDNYSPNPMRPFDEIRGYWIKNVKGGLGSETPVDPDTVELIENPEAKRFKENWKNQIKQNEGVHKLYTKARIENSRLREDFEQYKRDTQELIILERKWPNLTITELKRGFELRLKVMGTTEQGE